MDGCLFWDGDDRSVCVELDTSKKCARIDRIGVLNGKTLTRGWISRKNKNEKNGLTYRGVV
jgi:hypothetical protein